MSEPGEAAQAEVIEWFDHTYATEGFKYLRPLASYPIFLQFLEARPGAALLDVACGPGLLLKAAELRGLAASGVDVSREALAIASEYVPDAVLREGNAEELPFESESFDYVTCIGAIERFLDRERALGEMLRVARPDARFCFMVRNASTFTWRVWRQLLGQQNRRGHQDALELDEWRQLLERVGFRILEVHPDQWPRQRLRRWLGGARTPEPGRDEPVAEPILPLRYANEFVFVMEKREAPGR